MNNRVFTSPVGAVAKYCDEYVCLCVCWSVCLSARISLEPHAPSLPIFLCMLPMSVAWSSSDVFTGALFHFFGGGKLGPHLTQCHLGQGLPPYQAAS